MNASDTYTVTRSKLLSVDEALDQIEAQIQPITGVEKISLRKSLGRVLAKDLFASVNIPAQRLSSMDGYAINGHEIPSSGERSLTIVGISWAGRPFEGQLAPAQCIRVFTGAIIPDSADTVVMQENVARIENRIVIRDDINPFDNVRLPGDDIKIDQHILSKGKRLTPADLGLLASLGKLEIPIMRKLKVAFFSTGDELQPLGTLLDEGKIYDSNRYTLYAMLQELDITILDMGVIPDRKESLKHAFLEAASCNDVLLTSGGVSVGEADFVKQTLDRVGQVNLWRIAMKPGKPLAYGQIGNCHFFGLPGNPVSVIVTFVEIVKPALLKLMGAKCKRPLRLRARCVSKLKKNPGRQEFQRGVFKFDSDGELTVTSAGFQGSHILSSMSNANCFIILAAENEGVAVGDDVQIELFDAML